MGATTTALEVATAEVDAKDGSINEAFLFFPPSFVWEGPGVGAAVGRTTTVLFLMASRIFAWSSALSKKVSGREYFWLWRSYPKVCHPMADSGRTLPTAPRI